jgi:membrane protease YdiL (CAAX protease family)
MFSQVTPISDKTPTQSLLRIAITIFTGFLLVGPFLGVSLAAVVYDIDFEAFFNAENMGPAMVNPLLLLQAMTTFIGLILFPIIHITKLEYKPLSLFFSNRAQLTFVLGMVALLALAFPIAISPITEWNASLVFPEFMGGFEKWARQQEEVMGQMTQLLTSFDTIGGLMVALFVIGVLPAIGEELAFRGLIQNELWRGTNNVHIAIWVSAFVFSAIHMQFFGFFPRMLLGALFGYLYYWSGNLHVPIVAHFINNAFGVITIYLANIEAISTDLVETESAPWPWVVIGVVVAALLLTQVRNLYLNSPVGASTKSY